MIVYRLVRKDRKSLDGKGAALYPGRWNEIDIPCLYTSASRSLAQLEVMVNVDDWKLFLSVPHVVLHIEIPDKKIKHLAEDKLPEGWDDAIHSSDTQLFGTSLLKDPRILAFSVPSAVSKLERNIIINPRANDFDQVRLVEISNFEFDERLMR